MKPTLGNSYNNVHVLKYPIARPMSKRSCSQGELLMLKDTAGDELTNAQLQEKMRELKALVNALGRYLLKIEPAILSLNCYKPLCQFPKSSVATKSAPSSQQKKRPRKLESFSFLLIRFTSVFLLMIVI